MPKKKAVKKPPVYSADEIFIHDAFRSALELLQMGDRYYYGKVSQIGLLFDNELQCLFATDTVAVASFKIPIPFQGVRGLLLATVPRITQKMRKTCNKRYEDDFEAGRVYTVRAMLQSLGEESDRKIPLVGMGGVTIGGTVYEYRFADDATPLKSGPCTLGPRTLGGIAEKLRAVVNVQPGEVYKEMTLSTPQYESLLRKAEMTPDEIKINFLADLQELGIYDRDHIKRENPDFKEIAVEIDPRELRACLSRFRPDRIGFWCGTFNGAPREEGFTANDIEVLTLSGEKFRYAVSAVLI